MTLDRHLIHCGHEHRFVVTEDLQGWDVREEEDAIMVRHVHHDDWHRVERDTWLFELRAVELKQGGWIEG
jgi:hypothetical protein